MKPSTPLVDPVPANQPRISAADAAGGNVEAGRVVFQRICAACHGDNGKGGHSEGAILPDNVTAQTAMTTAMTGKKDMPSFENVLSQQELKDVAAYVARLLAR